MPSIAPIRCSFCPLEFVPKRRDSNCCGADVCRREQKRRNNRERERRIFAESGEWRSRAVERANPTIIEKNRSRDRARNLEMPDRKRYAASNAARDARRRIRKLETADTTVEAFTRDEIGDRDEWTCGLCHEHVDRTIPAWVPGTWIPDRRSASIDHVIPLVQGGAHTRENVQIAHLGCNVDKSDALLAA